MAYASLGRQTSLADGAQQRMSFSPYATKILPACSKRHVSMAKFCHLQPGANGTSPR